MLHEHVYTHPNKFQMPLPNGIKNTVNIYVHADAHLPAKSCTSLWSLPLL